MAGKRGSRGRFEPLEALVPEEKAAPVKAAGKRAKAPRPRYCRVFARARFAEAMPEIAETLLTEAKKGSVAHLKLLVQLSGLEKDVVPRKAKPRGKSLEAILTEQWAKDKAEAALRPSTGLTGPERTLTGEVDPFGLLE